MLIMGIDYGDKRTGVAISDPTGTISGRAFTVTMSERAALVRRLADIAREEKIEVIVVGKPLNMDGSAGPRAEACAALADELAAAAGLRVDMIDERLTTVSAYSYLRAGGKNARKGKKEVDAVAASIILQQYLDGMK